jgi:hypothetical protein
MSEKFQISLEAKLTVLKACLSASTNLPRKIPQ